MDMLVRQAAVLGWRHLERREFTAVSGSVQLQMSH
jgi:hypothetical protein